LTVQQALQRGLEHQQAGELAEAERIYRSVLTTEPNNAEALHLLGTIAAQVGKPEAAVELIRKAISLRPSSAYFLNNLGNALKALGRTKEAEESYRKAIAIDPDFAEAHCGLGHLLHRVRRFGEAVESYDRALVLKPNDPEAHNALGNTRKELGLLQEAQHSYIQALRLKPDHAYAHNNLATTFFDQGRWRDAEQSYRRALALNAKLFEPNYNLGNLLRVVGKPDEAAQSYRIALALNPGRPEAHYSLGLALQALGRSDEAERCYRQALLLKPDYPEAHCLWVHQCQRLCDWSTLDREVSVLRNRIKQRPSSKTFPFTFLTLPDSSPLEQYECARQYAEIEYRNLIFRAPLCGASRSRNMSKLRVGYLSADFHGHATSHLLSEVIEQHNRRRFEVYAYSYGPDDKSPLSRRIRAAFDVLRDIKDLATEPAARQIVADEIDILVDLKGYTDNHRLEICALRPAPVQVSWLGYPGTLGHPRLADYLIGDPIVSPLEHADRYSELLALMPHCYQPNDRKRPIPAPPTRAEAGLPEKGFVFCSFNWSYKITPPVFDLWCRLLHAVPGSVLWLLQTTRTAKENLLKEAETRRIAQERIVFAPLVPLDKHLGRLQLADLALDTYPVTSHTTASDAVWSGVPLVTLLGETFVARVAASILNAAGLPDLITKSADSYFDLAQTIASNREKLKHLKARLAANRMTCPLFDSARFTRDLERLYTRMWTDYRAGRRRSISLTAEKLPFARSRI